MKKVLLLIALLLLTLLSLPFIGWWMTLQPEPVIAYQQAHKISHADIDRINQLVGVHGLSNSKGRVIQLREDDLNTLLQYGSQQLAQTADIDAAITLHEQQSTLLVSFNSHLALRPFINLSVHFDTRGRELLLLGGQIGSFELPQASMELLLRLATPYMQKHPQYASSQTLWQTVEDVSIRDRQVTITLANNKALQAQFQQQQLQALVGKTALERLPFYQAALDKALPATPGKVSLQQAMTRLFEIAKQQQALHADSVADNKAIILSLFLHTGSVADFSLLQLGNSVQLPAQGRRFTLERRIDLAQHFLTTATIALFANSAIADAVGLYKELQDQNGHSGFDASDLVADRAGSVLASKLISDINTAKLLQTKLAAVKNESDFLPNTRRIVPEVERLLLADEYSQDQRLDRIEQLVSNYVLKAPIYQ